MQLLPGGGGGSNLGDMLSFGAGGRKVATSITDLLTPKLPEPRDIPPVPSRSDTAVSEARRKQMELDKLRRGRSASILTGSRGVEGELGSVSRPAARAAQLLGQ